MRPGSVIAGHSAAASEADGLVSEQEHYAIVNITRTTTITQKSNNGFCRKI